MFQRQEAPSAGTRSGGAPAASSSCRGGGRLMAEFGDGQEQSVAKLFREANWLDVGIADDLSDRPRIVIASAEH